jgi:SHS2 domain-containing protein
VLHIELGGAPIASQEKEIKAVTYHNLVIRRIHKGLAANIVFDV